MSQPLLEVRNLTKSFIVSRSLTGKPSASVCAVDDVSFEIKSGETLALVGESGCGKSTAGRLVLRLIEATGGQVFFAGSDVGAMRPAALRRFRAKAQLVFQDPFASLNPRMTIGAALAEPIMLHTGLDSAKRQLRVAELLEMVGLKEDFASRYPHEFSGGQRQRIAIARALAGSPKLIVCDEPVSALDVSIRAQILNLLKDLQQKLGLAYLFISHDIGVVKHIADRVAVMYLGRIVEIGTADQVFAEPRHPYTQALFSAIPLPEPRRNHLRTLMSGDPPSPISPPAGCHLHPRCPYAIERCSLDSPALLGDADGHATACHIWPGIDATDVTPVETPWSPSLKKLVAAFEVQNA